MPPCSSRRARPGRPPALPVSAVVDDDGQATAANCNATAATPATIAAGITAASNNSILKVCRRTYAPPVTVPGGKVGLQLHGAHAGKGARNRKPNDAGATVLTGGITLAGDDQSVTASRSRARRATACS